jgi:hypothetical protein
MMQEIRHQYEIEPPSPFKIKRAASDSSVPTIYPHHLRVRSSNCQHFIPIYGRHHSIIARSRDLYAVEAMPSCDIEHCTRPFL